MTSIEQTDTNSARELRLIGRARQKRRGAAHGTFGAMRGSMKR